MNRQILQTLGEWAALGFYEGLSLPWPRSYGLAWRRLYENMQINIPDNRLLFPVEPLPHARTMATHQVWYATSLICDFDHNRGLRVNPEIATARQQQFPQHADFIEALVKDLTPRLPHFGGYTHSNPDIRRIVTEGFDAIEHELLAEIATVKLEMNQSREFSDQTTLQLLLALQDYVAGVRAFHRRTSMALNEKVKKLTGAPKAELQKIASAFASSFFAPAKNFLQGILAVHFLWLLDGHDSIGRFDQALGPLFENDLTNGTLSLDFARRLLDEFWQNFERLNGWNLQLGGLTLSGVDGCNRLTYECLLACKRNVQRRPNVAFRLTRNTPPEFFRTALETLQNGTGRPVFYHEEAYLTQLLRLFPQMTPADACELGFGGCTETMFSGRSNMGSLEGDLNLAKALELALFNGRDPLTDKQTGPETGNFADFQSFPDFLNAVKIQISNLTQNFVEQMNLQLHRRFHQGDPKLYRTLFTRDCVKNRKSFEAGGARYNGSVVSYCGIANLIDSLAAIKFCIFERRFFSQNTLLAALQTNFAGYEQIRQHLLAVPKFGNDDDQVDLLGREILKFSWELLLQQPHPRNGRYLPACILFVNYESHGKIVGATPDGRRAFEPLSDSVGAAVGNDRSGPTALLNSVVKLPLELAMGTPVLNLRLTPQMIQSEKGITAVMALIRSFFKNGGLQIQFTVVNANDLIAAQNHPEKFQNLIVRIGGFSEYFTRLTPKLQASIIARIEHSC